MKIPRALVLVVIATFAISVSADQASDKKSLDAAYGRLTAAIKRKDVKALMGMVTSDFSWIDAQGKVMDRGAFFAMCKKEFGNPNMKFISLVMTNDSYDFDGTIARVRTRTAGSVSMKMGGQAMKMSSKSEGVDTWQKTPAGWRVKKVEVVSETMGG